MMIFLSAPGKFMDFEGKEEMFAKLGWGIEVMKTIGVIEIAVAILYLIPRTAFIGAVLVTAYLGGAIATHVRINDHFIFPVIMGVLVWVALGLPRRPHLHHGPSPHRRNRSPTSKHLPSPGLRPGVDSHSVWQRRARGRPIPGRSPGLEHEGAHSSLAIAASIFLKYSMLR